MAMTTRRWWAAGAALVILIALAAATLIPINEHAVRSTAVSGSIKVVWAPLDDCAVVTTHAELTSREVTPLLNVFGLAQLRDLELSDLTLHAGLDDSCPAPTAPERAIYEIAPLVAIAHPRCGQNDWSGYALRDEAVGEDGLPGIGTLCDGDLLVWDRGELSRRLEWDESFTDQTFPLSGTGLIADDTWCLVYEPRIRIGVQSGTQTFAGPDGVVRDFCVPVGG